MKLSFGTWWRWAVYRVMFRLWLGLDTLRYRLEDAMNYRLLELYYRLGADDFVGLINPLLGEVGLEMTRAPRSPAGPPPPFPQYGDDVPN